MKMVLKYLILFIVGVVFFNTAEISRLNDNMESDFCRSDRAASVEYLSSSAVYADVGCSLHDIFANKLSSKTEYERTEKNPRKKTDYSRSVKTISPETKNTGQEQSPVISLSVNKLDKPFVALHRLII